MEGKRLYMILLCLSLLSCGWGDNEMTPEERYTVDTLFSNQLNQFRGHVDSLCLASKDTLFAHTVDSLKIAGMKEIEMLLTKNHVVE